MFLSSVCLCLIICHFSKLQNWFVHHIFAFRQHEGECKKFNNDFISSHNQFTACVLNNKNNDARESYCYRCLKPYHRLVHNYTLFASGFTNVTGYNETCRSLYFDTNQLNLVETVYKNAIQLYDIAFCKGSFMISAISLQITIFHSIPSRSEQIVLTNLANGAIREAIAPNPRQQLHLKFYTMKHWIVSHHHRIEEVHATLAISITRISTKSTTSFDWKVLINFALISKIWYVKIRCVWCNWQFLLDF